MRKLILLCLLFFSKYTSGIAQFQSYEKFLEIGLAVNATNYSGDLAPDHISFAQTRMGTGAFVRIHLTDFFKIRGQFVLAQLFGDDKNNKPNSGRNFRFNTLVMEPAVLLEGTLAVFDYEPVSSDGSYFFAPYLVAGVGAALVNPRVTYYGPEDQRTRFVVEPLPEGGKSARTLITTPFGLGLRMFSDTGRLGFGVEVCARPVFSDFLDGVSANGNPAHDDWYYTLGLNVSYRVGRQSFR